MSLVKKISLVSALAITLAAPSFAQDAPTSDTVVATVNGEEIQLGHIISLMESLPPEYAQVPAAELYKGILDQLVQQTLLEQNAPEGMISEKKIAMALDNERRAMISAISLQKVAEEAVTDEAVQALYEKQITSGEPTPEFQASHILVETEEEAKEILKLAQDGGDFAELAKEKSTGPSGPNGGDLGWFGRGAMVPEFDQAVADMTVGDVSGPIKTQFGWHVIRLNDKRDYPTLESQRAELTGQVRSAAIANAIEGLEAGAKVEMVEPTFDLEQIRNTDLLK